jgi:hypothetical protein
MLSEIRQTQKQILHVFSHMQNLEPKKKMFMNINRGLFGGGTSDRQKW